ncbi:acyltransferase [Pectobacteriaceae bacterium CE70]|nr:acyltransferase [Pectobacteriaceae bacterium C52]WJV67070.1 acyltransferase [Pectobacteriaceae bacterium CE70]WJY11054.1 acyltransferase [Pectobacteriaceae bacterium C80]
MTGKIRWIDNLRAVACMMVVLIHSTSWYVTTGGEPGDNYWEVANILNSASRVCVPLFFMISGYLFFGERQARGKHFLRIGLCILFYSVVALLYMSTLTPMNPLHAINHILQKPVFYHLWFFYAIVVIYLLSPLICVRLTSVSYLMAVIVVLAVIANPNAGDWLVDGRKWFPVNLYVSGDTFYYLLYAITGRALGMVDIPRNVARAAVGVFVLCVVLIAVGTRQQTEVNGDFAQTFYTYCSPLVFIAATSLLLVFKNYLNVPVSSGLALISRHSLAIYGVHALVIHFLRTHDLELTDYPVLDIIYVFAVALMVSLLFSMLLQRVDKRRLIC